MWYGCVPYRIVNLSMLRIITNAVLVTPNQCMMCTECRKEVDRSTHNVIAGAEQWQIGSVRAL